MAILSLLFFKENTAAHFSSAQGSRRKIAVRSREHLLTDLLQSTASGLTDGQVLIRWRIFIHPAVGIETGRFAISAGRCLPLHRKRTLRIEPHNFRVDPTATLAARVRGVRYLIRQRTFRPRACLRKNRAVL